ncbi:MAG: L,D-transpeptidase [Chloroflexota bacterium]|jgi:hypothetical protein
MSRLGIPHIRGNIVIVVALGIIAVCTFMVAAMDITTASAFDPRWVQNHQETELWSGPDANAVSFGRVPQWSYFQAIGPQQDSRLYVWNPQTNNYAFIDAAAVGPSGAPPTATPTPPPTPTPSWQIPSVPPGYENWWVANFVETTLWSTPGPDAEPIWEVPQFRRFMVVAEQQGDKLKVWSPEKDRIGYINALDVGPSDPSIFITLYIQSPKVVREINLPGRSVGANTFLRSLPIDHEEAEIRHLPNNTPITVLREVETSDGERWYQVNQEEYLKGSEVRIPTPPTTTFEGKWIDVELETPAIVTAYEGNRAVFSCLTIKGYAATPTRTGIYTILRRVADETMDSETIGIPRDAPGGYHLKHVLYTQYFTSDGASFHYNYWLGTFGWPGSHGCLGLSLNDSKWLWDWATVGTPVVIR